MKVILIVGEEKKKKSIKKKKKRSGKGEFLSLKRRRPIGTGQAVPCDLPRAAHRRESAKDGEGLLPFLLEVSLLLRLVGVAYPPSFLILNTLCWPIQRRLDGKEKGATALLAGRNPDLRICQ